MKTAARLAFALFLPWLAHAAPPLTLTNPGFEQGLARWFASDTDKALGQSKTTAQAARSGNLGLNVTQKEGDTGSWLSSERLSVEPGVGHRVSFWARSAVASGIGVWVAFHDAEKKDLKTPKEIAILIDGEPGDWKLYHLDVTPPPGAAFATLAVHGFNRRVVDADFDDFSFVALGAPALP